MANGRSTGSRSSMQAALIIPQGLYRGSNSRSASSHPAQSSSSRVLGQAKSQETPLPPPPPPARPMTWGEADVFRQRKCQVSERARAHTHTHTYIHTRARARTSSILERSRCGVSLRFMACYGSKPVWLVSLL